MSKKKRVEIEEFLKQYQAAVESKMTREDFAKSVGVLPATVYQRVYELQRGGLDIPQLRSRSKQPLIDRAKAAWKTKPDGKVEAEVKAEVKAETKPEPTPEPKREPRVKAETKSKPEPTVNNDVMDELNKLLGG